MPDDAPKPQKPRPFKDKTVAELLAMSESLKDRASQLDEELRQLASEMEERRAGRQDRASRIQ